MDIFLGYLSKTLNLDIESVRAMLYKKGDDGTITEEISETALNDLLAADAERITGLQSKGKEAFDNGYKKAQREVAEKLETAIRKRAGITDTALIGEALLDAAFTPKDDATTEDKVKRHPLYLNLEKSLQEQAARFEQEKEAAVSEVKNEFRRTQTRGQAVKLATDFFHSLKPILPSDTAKAQKQVDLFLSSTLNGLEFDTDEAGNIVGLVKDGKRYEDAHGHAYDLNRVVKEAAAAVYDFHQQEPISNGGNKPGVPDPAKPTPQNIPKTMAEFQALPMDKQIQYADAFEKAQRQQQ